MLKKTSLKLSMWTAILGIAAGIYSAITRSRISSIICILLFAAIIVLSLKGIMSKEIGEEELEKIHKAVGK